MNKKIINAYNKATNNLAIAFVSKYYGKECVKDMDWAGGNIGGVLCINDEFWGVDNMKEALEFKASADQLFEYYEYESELHEREENPVINFRNYLKLGAIWKKK